MASPGPAASASRLRNFFALEVSFQARSKSAVFLVRKMCASHSKHVPEFQRKEDDYPEVIEKMVRPERFELPTFWFVARRSIQLS
jgi:hypothetical protein